MLESHPGEQLAVSINDGRSHRPQRILATILAIPTLILLMAGLGMAAEIIRGDLKLLKSLPAIAPIAFSSGALSYSFYRGRGLPSWFLPWIWTMMTAAVVWATISTIWKSLRDGNVDFGTLFACGLPIVMCIYAFKAFWASK
jgi:hypothetical protein